MMQLTADLAAKFAALTLGHLGRQYPYKADLILIGPEDAVPPIVLHPIKMRSALYGYCRPRWPSVRDRKSTRLNSSHG